eukprot:TRINITY_DN63049_c0_g1_i1.p1 TRINITY_DN63049_c0_g1~~TRINITY_DN63049_c0_g1_i1.p1  ORF type:complete len:762 (-),score=205.22 TRINITY_DN63049_c0_g1_i1:103-2388(-)
MKGIFQRACVQALLLLSVSVPSAFAGFTVEGHEFRAQPHASEGAAAAGGDEERTRKMDLCRGNVDERMRTYSDTFEEGEPGSEFVRSQLGSHQAWRPSNLQGPHWVVLDLGRQMKVDSITTQGRKDADEWVTKYFLQASKNAIDWDDVGAFQGNVDRNTKRTNYLQRDVWARYLRIIIHDRDKHGHLALRVGAGVSQCFVPFEGRFWLWGQYLTDRTGVPMWFLLIIMLITFFLFLWARGVTFFSSEAKKADEGTEETGELGENADELPTTLRELQEKRIQLVVEQSQTQQQLEQTLASIQAALHELDPATHKAPSQDSVRLEAEEAQEATFLVKSKSVLGAAQKMASDLVKPEKLQATSDKIMDTMEGQVDETRKSVAGVIKEELFSLSKDVTDAIEEGSNLQLNTLVEVSLYNLPIFFNCSTARAQLSMIYGASTVACIIRGLNALLGGAVLIFFQPFCPYKLFGQDDFFFIWYTTDCFANCYFLLVTLRVISVIGDALNEESYMNKQEDLDMSSVQGMGSVHKMFDALLGNNSEAMSRLYSIETSFFYKLSRWSSVYDLIALSFAVHVTFNEPWKRCPHLSLTIIRVRGLLFLMTLPVYLFGMVQTIVNAIMPSVLGTGETDEEHPGFVILFLRAVFLRDPKDLAVINLRMKQYDLAVKQAEVNAKKAKLQGVLAEKERIESQVEWLLGRRPDAVRDEDKFKDEYMQAKTTFFNESKKFLEKMKATDARARAAATDLAEETQRFVRETQEGGPKRRSG